MIPFTGETDHYLFDRFLIFDVLVLWKSNVVSSTYFTLKIVFISTLQAMQTVLSTTAANNISSLCPTSSRLCYNKFGMNYVKTITRSHRFNQGLSSTRILGLFLALSYRNISFRPKFR